MLHLRKDNLECIFSFPHRFLVLAILKYLFDDTDCLIYLTCDTVWSRNSCGKGKLCLVILKKHITIKIISP